MDHGQLRAERVILETERHRIVGLLTVARDGYRSRVSEVLNASEREFISLADATVTRLDGGVEPQHHSFLAVSRHHVVLALEDPA